MDEVEELPPGWYRQQTDPSLLRWWDGHDWTDDVLDAPRDPMADPDDEDLAAERPPRRRREPLRPIEAAADAPAPTTEDLAALPKPSDDDEPWVRITDDGQIAPGSGARSSAPQPERRSRAVPDRAGTTRSNGPRPRKPTPGPARRPAPGRTSGPARAGGAPPGRRPPPRGATGARSPSAARRPPATPHLGHFALRVVAAAVVAVVAYLLVKPFIDGSSDARTVSEEATPPTTVVADGSTADGRPPLSEAVLRLSELPTGWAIQAELAGARAGFCGGRNPLAALVPAEELRATFSQGPEGPFITSLTARYATHDEAELLLDLVAQTFETCRTYEEGGGTVTLESTDFPKLGDDTIAAHVVVSSPEATLEGDVVWVRRGSRVLTISSIAFGAFDVDLVELLAASVTRRL